MEYQGDEPTQFYGTQHRNTGRRLRDAGLDKLRVHEPRRPRR